MPDWPEPPKLLGKPKAESFGSALRAAIKAEFGTNKAFAEAAGFQNASSVTHFISGPDEVTPKTLRKILELFDSPTLQDRVYRAWIREFAPSPDLPDGLSPQGFLAKLEELFAAGLIHKALSLGSKRLQSARDSREWQRIAERIFPLQLRLGRVSHAWQLRSKIEENAIEHGDSFGIISALAMRGTALRATDATTVKALTHAHEHTLSFLEQWQPITSGDRERRRARLASIWREFSLCILYLHERGMIGDNELTTALSAANRSKLSDSAPHLSATALEVKSRVELAQGHYFQAEETLDELVELGLESGWENWEKTQMTRAVVMEKRGDRGAAIQILIEVRDYSLLTENMHFFRKSDQELSRLLAGL